MSRKISQYAAGHVGSEFGVVAARGAGRYRAAAGRRARAAAAGHVVPLPMPKMKTDFDPRAASVNGDGSFARRCRWVAAYIGSVTYYGLPYGTPVAPCYLCGDLFHVETMDGEHIRDRARHGTPAGGLLLGCTACNGFKDQRAIAESVADDIVSVTRSAGFPRWGDLTRTVFYAFGARRSDGKEQPSTPWQG